MGEGPPCFLATTKLWAGAELLLNFGRGPPCFLATTKLWAGAEGGHFNEVL